MADYGTADCTAPFPEKPPIETRKLKTAPIDPAVIYVRQRYREDGGRSLSDSERALLVSSLPLFAD